VSVTVPSAQECRVEEVLEVTQKTDELTSAVQNLARKLLDGFDPLTAGFGTPGKGVPRRGV